MTPGEGRRATRTTARSPSVTVAVVASTGEDRLEACLASLRDDAEAGRAAAYVTAPVAGEPYAALVNRVAADSRSEWIAVADVDFVVAPGAVARLVAAGRRDPRSAVVAPRVLAPDGRTEVTVRPFPGPGTALRATLHVDRLVPGARRARRTADGREAPRRVPWAFASFLLLRRGALAAVGGLDERLRRHAAELDLCWRLARAGWATRYEPGAVIRRQPGTVPREAFGEPHTRLDVGVEWGWLARRRGAHVAVPTALLATGHSAGRAAAHTLLGRGRGRSCAQARADLAVKLEALGTAVRPA